MTKSTLSWILYKLTSRTRGAEAKASGGNLNSGLLGREAFAAGSYLRVNCIHLSLTCPNLLLCLTDDRLDRCNRISVITGEVKMDLKLRRLALGNQACRGVAQPLGHLQSGQAEQR